MKSNSRINKQEQVQVVIRLKPQDQENKSQRCAYLASEDSNALVVEIPNKKEFFVFDAIANQNTSQLQLYLNIGREAVTQSLEGYNCCIFAYGQTGSGKTYSILGILQDIFQNIYAQTRGILPRLLEDLFKQVQSAADKIVIRCSYMQIYNQQIFDLLNDNVKFLQIREGPQRGVFVEGLDLLKTSTYQEAINILLQGQKNRKIAETDMNKESSRSHTIFSINIESQITEQDVIKTRRSKINIVDLAGSQRVKHTNVQGQRLRQGCNINRSLHVLGNVINALVESSKKKKHIPFRDSKLTYYLKDSLGGNSITKLLANIQCNSKFIGDTLSTLMFAKRAKSLKMKVQVNQNATENYDALRKQVKKLREELAQAKYINQTRISDRFQTQNQTELILEKIDTSNFQQSSTDKPIQVFEQNELHYKALIQIYEQHMKQCTSLNNQNYNTENNTFTKKKNSNILSHSQWKKIEKKNATLMNLIKRMPAFTKIYRENQLLKQQRNQDKKILNIKKQESYTGNKIPFCSTSLHQQESSSFDVPQQSFIVTHQQELIREAVQRTIQLYESMITEMRTKFNQCLDEVDSSYSDLQKQIQQKDRKIKQISKRQNQLPSNIEELIDENQYLKLNILQLQSQMNDLYKQLDQARIKQKEVGRRYSVFQEPWSNKKSNSPNQNEQWMSHSLNFQQLNNLTNKKDLELNLPLFQAIPQLQLNRQIIDRLQNIKIQSLRWEQQYFQQRQKMIDCIQQLQKQCKKLINENKLHILKSQDLKAQIKKNVDQVKIKYPQCEFGNLSQLCNSKQRQDLWKQYASQKQIQQNYQLFRKQSQAQKQSLYIKLKEMQKVQAQLDQFATKQKAIEKQFGKSINQILDEYADIVISKSHLKSVGRSNGNGSSKLLTGSRSSKLFGHHSGGSIENVKQYDSTQRTQNVQTSSRKKQQSKASSRKSQNEEAFFYRSQKK